MARTLAAAFADDPAMAFMIPDRAERVRRLERFFPLVVAEDLAAGHALHAPGSEVVTLWRGPDNLHVPLWRMAGALAGYWRALGGNLGRAMRLSSAIAAHQPRDLRFSHLHFAGVDPAFQGKGWGGTAIRAGQDRARAAGLPIFLETATPSNVGLYQRLGFTITGEYDVSGPRGPHFWTMLWRG